MIMKMMAMMVVAMTMGANYANTVGKILRDTQLAAQGSPIMTLAVLIMINDGEEQDEGIVDIVLEVAPLETKFFCHLKNKSTNLI